MTAEELYIFLSRWIKTVTDPGMLVIQAYSDAPAPKGEYFAVDVNSAWIPAGKRTEDPTDGTERVIRSDYEVPVSIWNVRGTGESILTVAEALQNHVTRLHFDENKVSIFRVGSVMRLPVLNDKSVWIIQNKLELVLSVTRGTLEAMPSIGAVSIEGTLNEDFTVDIEVDEDIPPTGG